MFTRQFFKIIQQKIATLHGGLLKFEKNIYLLIGKPQKKFFSNGSAIKGGGGKDRAIKKK